MNTSEGSNSSNNYFKQKRDEYLVDIRKKKNVERISQKRVKFANANFSENNTADESDTMPIPPLQELADKFMEAFRSGDLTNLAIILKLIRRAVSFDESPPVAELMHTGIVPHIVELLSPSYYEEGSIITEASWIAANIASKEATHVNFLVSLEIISVALRLLSYPLKEVNENALYILANIAGESVGYRDAILQQGVADVLDVFAERAQFDTKTISNVSWLIANLCGIKKPYPPFEAIVPFLRYIQNFLKTSTDEETLENCMMSLVYITRGGGESEVQEVLQMDITEDLFKCLKFDSRRLKNATLKTIGNILYESDQQVQVLMNAGLVEAVYPLLSDAHQLVRNQASFVFANLLGGTSEQVKEIIDWCNGQVVKTLMELVKRDHPDVSEQALYALCNACDSGNMQEVTYLVKLGLIDLLVDQLRVQTNVTIVTACLSAIDNILKEGEDMMMGTDPEENPFFVALNECDGMSLIEKLQNFPDDTVFSITESILLRYSPQNIS